ncbi:hypothetical protein OBBRIDRAFT_800278 [Obba rivulosa]|uniref:Uncharacterized protein n=1 Tax=Obba rivulosa TaxID=1052685 RepID=A0A8E2DUD9_9APHY|nr:hypothetical protein OBBRIDRAFT_800278 [Obba rivulosa]
MAAHEKDASRRVAAPRGRGVSRPEPGSATGRVPDPALWPQQRCRPLQMNPPPYPFIEHPRITTLPHASQSSVDDNDEYDEYMPTPSELEELEHMEAEQDANLNDSLFSEGMEGGAESSQVSATQAYGQGYGPPLSYASTSAASVLAPRTPQMPLHIQVEPPSQDGHGGVVPADDLVFPDPMAGLPPVLTPAPAPASPAVAPLAVTALPVSDITNGAQPVNTVTAPPLITAADVSRPVDDTLVKDVVDGDEEVRGDYIIDADEVDVEETEEMQEKRRLSGELLKRLVQKCRGIDMLFQNITTSESVKVEQVERLWTSLHTQKRQSVNLWGLYQMYFSEHSRSECKRLGPNKMGKILVSPDVKIASMCFAKFKEAYANDEEKMRKILLTHYRLHILLEGEGRTVGSRKRVFNKFTGDLVNSFDNAHMKHGFESVFIASGNNPQQDDGVGFVYESPGAQGFIEWVTKTDKDTVVGHLQSHASYLVSGNVIQRTHEGHHLTEQAAHNKSEPVAGPFKPEPDDRRSETPAVTVAMIAGPPPCGGQALLKYLRLRMTMLTSTAQGIREIDVGTQCSKKGIAVLKDGQRECLVQALNHPTDPLKCTPNHEYNHSGKGNRDYLAIIGAAPKVTSKHVCGLQIFWSTSARAPWADQKGLPRQTMADSGTSPFQPAAADERGATTSSSSPPLRRIRKRVVPAVESEDDKSGRATEDVEEDELVDSEPEPPKAKRVRIDMLPTPPKPAPSRTTRSQIKVPANISMNVASPAPDKMRLVPAAQAPLPDVGHTDSSLDSVQFISGPLGFTKAALKTQP